VPRLAKQSGAESKYDQKRGIVVIAPTHALYGPAIALIVLALFGVEASFHWSVIVCAILGSMAPDLDYTKSTIGQISPWISRRIETRFGHRTVTHSLLGTLVASITFTILIAILILVLRLTLPDSQPIPFLTAPDWWIPLTIPSLIRMSAAFLIGYISHLILDMLTPKGVQLFWPRLSRDVIFQNSFRIETASKHEIPVFLLGLVLLASAFPLSQYGPMTAFRWILATPEAAMAEFKSSTNRTDVEFDGYWTATKTPIHGTAEILEVHNKRLVIALETEPRETPSRPPVPPNPSASPLASAPPPATRAHRYSPLIDRILQIVLPDSKTKRLTDKSDSALRSRSAVAPNSPPTRTRVVVTLSDELSADIAAKKVHFIKRNTPLKVDKYSFKDQSKEDLLKRVPNDALISGVIYLPKWLKINAGMILGSNEENT